VGQPRVRRIFDVAHGCNPVLSVKHSIAEARMFGEKEMNREVRV